MNYDYLSKESILATQMLRTKIPIIGQMVSADDAVKMAEIIDEAMLFADVSTEEEALPRLEAEVARLNSGMRKILVQGVLAPSQRDTILAATKWIERICDRKEMLPASFMDNTDPASLAKELRAILDSENVKSVP